jgi:hypothetical protein
MPAGQAGFANYFLSKYLQISAWRKSGLSFNVLAHLIAPSWPSVLRIRVAADTTAKALRGRPMFRNRVTLLLHNGVPPALRRTLLRRMSFLPGTTDWGHVFSEM